MCQYPKVCLLLQEDYTPEENCSGFPCSPLFHRLMRHFPHLGKESTLPSFDATRLPCVGKIELKILNKEFGFSMAGVEMQDFSLRRKQYDKREVCEIV